MSKRPKRAYSEKAGKKSSSKKKAAKGAAGSKKKSGKPSTSSPNKQKGRRSRVSEDQETPRFGTGMYTMPDEKIEAALLRSEESSALKDLFGLEEYSELVQLAQEAAARSTRGAERVLILPGIMGSRLGRHRTLLPDDVIWLDPIDIARGRLEDLSRPHSDDGIEPLGVLLFTYLKLKYRLRSAGFDAVFRPFDWRRSIEDLGKQLRGWILAENRPVHLVAHSMGGLVSRAALTQSDMDSSRVRSLIMLGTPNHGSFVPVETFRAEAATLKKLAFIDLTNNARELVEKVISTFPSMCEMLPFAGSWSEVNLYRRGNWPDAAPRPTQSFLNAAKRVQKSLAPGEERFRLIAGVNQSTTVNLHREDGRFIYHRSNAGDGTVPLEFARLQGVDTWYVEEEHGSLPNNRRVAAAVIELLENGDTDVLPKFWEGERRAFDVRAQPEVPAVENDSSPSHVAGLAEIRELVSEFAAPYAHDAASTASTTSSKLSNEHVLDNVVVTRRMQHRLDIRLAKGSITDVDSRAYVLGLFRDVEPGGPALAIDDLLGGAVREFTQRRMFSSEVGEIFTVPAGRSRLFADYVVFAGLGFFDRLDAQAQRLTAENLVRAMIQTRIEEFATVLFGAGSGATVRSSLQNLIQGFVSGLLDADGEHRFRSITLCELDDDRYEEMKDELYRLASTELFDDIEVTFSEEPLMHRPFVAGAIQAAVPESPNCYLIVRQQATKYAPGGPWAADDPDASDRFVLEASILTALGKATVITREKVVENLDDLLVEIESNDWDPDEFGERLGRKLFDEGILEAIQGHAGTPLAVIHDALTSRIPWEVLKVGKNVPALYGGITRRYMAENLSVAKWLESRRQDPVLRVLLVINPTSDLDYAEEEFKRVYDILDGMAGVEIVVRHKEQATKRRLLADFSSGRFDVIHYAGHAFFDRLRPERSGVLCAGRNEVLSGADIARLDRVPTLAFFNACESGRIRSSDEKQREHLHIPNRLTTGSGFAEAFLRGGVPAFIGTYWPVADRAAAIFAGEFYRKLIRGETLGRAVLDGRIAVHAMRTEESVDWADYICYGASNSSIKRRGA